jgi:hypothetical protein
VLSRGGVTDGTGYARIGSHAVRVSLNTTRAITHGHYTLAFTLDSSHVTSNITVHVTVD